MKAVTREEISLLRKGKSVAATNLINEIILSTETPSMNKNSDQVPSHRKVRSRKKNLSIRISMLVPLFLSLSFSFSLFSLFALFLHSFFHFYLSSPFLSLSFSILSLSFFFFSLFSIALILLSIIPFLSLFLFSFLSLSLSLYSLYSLNSLHSLRSLCHLFHIYNVFKCKLFLRNHFPFQLFLSANAISIKSEMMQLLHSRSLSFFQVSRDLS